MKKVTASLVLLLCSGLIWAQSYELKSTVEIYQDMQKLKRGLRVLYIAAHPDDENTRLISWLENDQHIETAYLSLTRGQGGQNLIGDEKGDALGVIRTYELLEARKVDGAEQFFTRAIDFGYSKSAEESFEFWGKEEVLHDVVYVIRKFRPHVIITRFPPTRRAGHGHHEASAILAGEAFDMAGDPRAFPEQLNSMPTWKPTVLYHNTSTWWDDSYEKMSDAELLAEKMHKVNIGVFNDLVGYGMNEIASMARSKHRCQAFGTPRRRGDQFEYLKYVKGDWSETFLDDLKGVWSISQEHPDAITRVLDEWKFTEREANLALIRTHLLPKIAQRNMWAESGDMQLVYEQINELKRNLSGLRVEVFAGEDPVVVGSSYPVTIEVYNASTMAHTVEFKHESIDTTVKVKPNERLEWTEELMAPGLVSTPFWLRRPYEGWLYNIDKRTEIGLPKMKAVAIPYVFKLEGQYIRGESEVHRRWNDRSIGEIVEPLQFVNPISITPSVDFLIIQEGQGRTVEVTVEAFDDVEGLEHGMSSSGKISEVAGPTELKKGQQKKYSLDISYHEGESYKDFFVFANIDGTQSDQSRQIIDYDHLPKVVIHNPTTIDIRSLDLKMNDDLKLGYIPGSGDEIMQNLQNIGYDVKEVSMNEVSDEELSEYDVIITGVRAYNRNDDLAANKDRLMSFVAKGGNVITMYNTTYDLKVQSVGPFDLELSRNRVTDETSGVNLLQTSHPIFTKPNAIFDDDWQNWVQERGLYFAGTWDDRYTPLIAWNDEGEDPQKGGLLIAKHGEGTFFYTGISFFRQLPAGVPGAYKLLVNMIEYAP